MVTASPICSMGNYILSLPLETLNRLPDPTSIGLTLRPSDTDDDGFTRRKARQDFIVRAIG
jgi:hypothetical protein